MRAQGKFNRTFILGISFGFLMAVIFYELQTSFYEMCSLLDTHGSPSGRSMEERYALLPGEEYEGNHLPLPAQPDKPHGPIIFNDLDSLHHKGGDKVARLLSKKIRVLCWIMTQPKTLWTKAQAVKDTWGKRCNVLVFMSSVEDKKFPVVGLNVPEGKLLCLKYYH